MKNKLLWSALLVALMLGLSPFIVYNVFFSGNLSATNSDWGSFGSFIGGFSSALLSTFSLIILIWTLHMTMKNSQIQLNKQDENHTNQLTQQKELHEAQMLLQRSLHEEQIAAQNEAQRQERSAASFTINNQLIMSHIENFNRIISTKEYTYFHSPSGKYYQSEMPSMNNYFLSRLAHHFSITVSKEDNPFFSVIKETRVGYKDELIPLISIIGIITNEENLQYQTNLISIFLAGTSRETTLWPLCYAMMHMPHLKKRLLTNGQLLVMPESMSGLQKQYSFKWTE